MREIVIVLCKYRTLYSKALVKLFEKQNIEAKMVVDIPRSESDDTMIVYDDEELRSKGFKGVQNIWFNRRIQDPGAWGKAFYFAAENYYDYYHFLNFFLLFSVQKYFVMVIFLHYILHDYFQ